MKLISLVSCAVAVVTGCSINHGTPMTSWGRDGVSMVDYRIDAAECAVLAASSNPMLDSGRQAGGITGSNGMGKVLNDSRSDTVPAPVGRMPSGPTPQQQTPTYRSENSDYANRAATAQRDQEMAMQRERTEALKFCLSNRGYTEFKLTSEQRARLDELAPGSEERRDYLYKLGTDQEVLARQAVKQRR